MDFPAQLVDIVVPFMDVHTASVNIPAQPVDVAVPSMDVAAPFIDVPTTFVDVTAPTMVVPDISVDTVRSSNPSNAPHPRQPYTDPDSDALRQKTNELIHDVRR